jgi:hypothetical protein
VVEPLELDDEELLPQPSPDVESVPEVELELAAAAALIAARRRASAAVVAVFPLLVVDVVPLPEFELEPSSPLSPWQPP